MAELAHIADHLVVLLHRQGADVLEAQHLRQLSGPLDGLRGVLFRWGNDEVGRGKVDLGGMLHAGSLPARHGVAGDEFHAVRAQGLDGLHQPGFDARDIGEDAAGFEQGAVSFEPLDHGGGVKRENDVVSALHQVLKIVGLAAADIAVVKGKLQVTLAAVDAVHGVACPGELQGVLAAQQAQAYDEIAFGFIQHSVPPRPAV